MNAVLTATSVMRRLVLTPVRIGLSAMLGGLFLLLSVVSNLNGEAIADELIMNGILLFVIPIIALVYAVGALGDAVDDGTLVYLWLKPLPRWQLGIGAMLATWQFVVPISALIGAGVALGAGQSDLLFPAVAACTLGVMAYSALFVGLGLRTTKSLLAGLVYVLIWEGFLATLSDSIATWSVRRWASALFSDLGGFRVSSPLPEASAWSATLVLVIIIAVGLALTTRWLTTRDVP